MLSLVSIGAFYIFMSYASAIGWALATWPPSLPIPIRTTFSAVHNGGGLVVRRPRHHQLRYCCWNRLR